MPEFTTLDEELTRAFQDNYGELHEGGPGVLDIETVRGEQYASLQRRVIVEEHGVDRRVFFTDPLTKKKAELALVLSPMPPIR